MEIPKRDLTRASAVIREDDDEENDELYEDIQAPKFVDLTDPNIARPADDASWFCLRIGCDQNHEQVDPEAIHRSFLLRVMAARSPNVRLQKAISSRNNQSLLPKCPHSAPAKPPRARITGLRTAAAVAAKAVKPMMTNHPISSLRASPSRTKAARIEVSSARKKALTTPRSKAAQPKQEPFLSAKHRKESAAAAPSKTTVVKALFMNTPKKEASETLLKSKTPVSEVCAKMRKLNLACREVPSRYLCQLTNPKSANKGEESAAKCLKRAQESRTTAKKRILGRSAKCANAETDEGNQDTCVNIVADKNSCSETASTNKEPKRELKGMRIEVEILQPDNSDDNKENLSYETSNGREGQNLQSENGENVPRKVAKIQSKMQAEQGGKLKKTTNPKPFRLRTDERSVLKEANPERKPMLVEKESAAVLRDRNGVVLQKEKFPDGKGSEKPICGDKQKKRRTQIGTNQLGEAKLVLNSVQCGTVRPSVTKGKVGEKSHKISRVATSARTIKTGSGFMSTPQLGKGRKTSVKTSRLQTAAA